jgi:Tyrosine phosphatase family
MAVRHGSRDFPQFSSMPNFRKLPSTCDLNTEDQTHDKPQLDAQEITLKLYRSSRPDFLTEVEVDQFMKLGIRCIIDFRSAREYRKASGSKLLDSMYPVYKVS